MKRNVILLVDADADTCTATLTAAQAAGFDVRFAQIQRDLSEITEIDLDDVAVMVLDYDPGVHGPATLEALERRLPARPLVLISSTKDGRHPYGPATHLTKPVTAEELGHAIEAVLSGCGAQAPCCDRWGHPCETIAG